MLAAVVAMSVASAATAQPAVYTIADGASRVLRGTTWFKAAPGAHARDGDIVEAAEHAQVQLELQGGGIVDIRGPGAFHIVTLAAGDNKAEFAEILLAGGWMKAAATPTKALRLRAGSSNIDLANAIVVVRADGRTIEAFVETGSAKIGTSTMRGKPSAMRDASAGELMSREGDAPLAVARPTQAFLAAMPREFRDALPALAARFPTERTLEPIGEVTLAEAEPWLVGGNRRAFVKRFAPRLSDPAFRAGVVARPAAFPEWDRIVRPERYRPKESDGGK